MIAAPELTSSRKRLSGSLQRVAGVQGVYFFLTSLWPLLSIHSFQVVTGPKTDVWLVYSTAILILVVGAVLILAAVTASITPEVALAALGSAIGLAGIDVVFVSRGVVSWVYLLDAVAQICLVSWWVSSYFNSGSTRVQHGTVESLLARGKSISPKQGPAL